MTATKGCATCAGRVAGSYYKCCGCGALLCDDCFLECLANDARPDVFDPTTDGGCVACGGGFNLWDREGAITSCQVEEMPPNCGCQKASK